MEKMTKSKKWYKSAFNLAAVRLGDDFLRETRNNGIISSECWKKIIASLEVHISQKYLLQTKMTFTVEKKDENNLNVHVPING